MINRAEWIRRFGDRLGVGSHRPLEGPEAWYAGQRLGAGSFGEVRSPRSRPELAVKRIPGTYSGEEARSLSGQPAVRYEVDIQSRLGNEFAESGEPVGLMPPIQGVTTKRNPEGGTEAYLEMPNLQVQGYRTLKDLQEDPSVPEHYLAQVAAEHALNKAWAARGGVAMNDDHPGNVMALNPSALSSRLDGALTQAIDAGLSVDISGSASHAQLARLQKQAQAIRDGYIQIGQRERGDQVSLAIDSELQGIYTQADGTMSASPKIASLLVDGALSDLAARVEDFNPAAWSAIRDEVLQRESERASTQGRAFAPIALSRELDRRAEVAERNVDLSWV